MKNRIFTMLMCLVLMVGVLPVTAMAAEVVAEGVCGDEYMWALTGEDLEWVLTDDGTLTISGESAMYDFGHSEAPWYDHKDMIKTVVIEDGVISIGSFAFDECGNLTKVTIPDSVRTIGGRAFMFCDSLTEISLPETLKSVGAYAFFECDSIIHFDLPASLEVVDMYAFARCSNLTEINVAEDNTNYCSDEFGVLFDKGKNVLLQAPAKLTGSYTVPDTVFGIAGYSFAENDLSEVILPASITLVEQNAFFDILYFDQDKPEIVRFEGDAPNFGDTYMFSNSTTVCYPEGNTTWDAVIESCSNNVTWVEGEPELEPEFVPEELPTEEIFEEETQDVESVNPAIEETEESSVVMYVIIGVAAVIVAVGIIVYILTKKRKSGIKENSDN